MEQLPTRRSVATRTHMLWLLHAWVAAPMRRCESLLLQIPTPALERPLWGCSLTTMQRLLRAVKNSGLREGMSSRAYRSASAKSARRWWQRCGQLQHLRVHAMGSNCREGQLGHEPQHLNALAGRMRWTTASPVRVTRSCQSLEAVPEGVTAFVSEW